MTLSFFVVFALLHSTLVFGHSWLDCVNVTNPNTVTNLSNMQCSGYPRGYVGRSNPDANMHKVEGMSQSTFNTYPACNSNTRDYTSQYPMLKLKAGEKMTVAYTPNGHTMWHSPPPPNGPRDSYIKWTGDSTKQLTTMQEVVNAANLAQIQFDTPCHSRVNGAELDSSSGICMLDITIPSTTPSGTYMLVWYWPFRFAGDNVIEDYTTCWDVEVTADTTVPIATTGTSSGNGVGTTETQSTTGTVAMTTESSTTTTTSQTVTSATGSNQPISDNLENSNENVDSTSEKTIKQSYVIIGAAVGGGLLLIAIIVIAILASKLRKSRIAGGLSF